MTGTGTESRKIAYLLEYPLDLPGGAQMSTQSLCTSLLGTRYEPLVVCPHLLKKKPGDYPFRVVTYDMGEGRLSNLMKRKKAFKRIIDSEKPDIVHIQMPESLITYHIAGIRSEKQGGPALIFTDRGLYFGYRPHTMILMKAALKRARVLLTTTEFNRRLWKEGSSLKRIEKISNTISESFDSFDPQKREKTAGEQSFTIGLAGRICEEKNWPFAVRLIEMMAEKGLKFRVSLVLSVFEKGDDEKVRSIVEGISAAIGKENLEFHQDYTQDEMQEYYYGVDVFMMTSRFESFGKAAVEAMSRGCAVISTDVGGLSEVIGRPENLYTEDNADRAVDYIRRASTDKAFLEAEQRYFYDRYRSCFSRETCLAEHLKIYDEI